jgi:hypothetical protein
VRSFLTVISSDQHLNPALQNITIPFDKALPALIEFFHDRSFVNLSTAEKGMCLPALLLILGIEQRTFYKIGMLNLLYCRKCES